MHAFVQASTTVGWAGAVKCLLLTPHRTFFSLFSHQGLDELDRDAEELLEVQLALHLDLLSRPWCVGAYVCSHPFASSPHVARHTQK